MVSDEEDAAPNSDNICNEINNGQSGVITVTCNYNNRNSPLRGRYVTVRRKDIAYERHLLNFCEVQVLSCHPGRWGYNLGSSAYDCSNACDRCRNISETCRVSDGHCYTGCRDGYWGEYCDKYCDCADDVPCRMLDGHCFTECVDGFWGERCDKQCDCPDEGPCDQTDGLCPGCNRTTGRPPVGESKRKGQMFFFQIFFLGKMAKYLC